VQEPSDKIQKSILVTGGAGYIGSVLVARLLDSGYRVRVLDNLSHGDSPDPGRSLLPITPHDNFEFIHGDIRVERDIDDALDSIDSVIHLAAIVGDQVCSKHPELAIEVNERGSQLLCHLAIKHGIRRFIFASTCSNYGRMVDADGYVDETSPLNPISHYARLKVGFEQYLLTLNEPAFEPVCLRFATAYGLSHRPRFDLTVNEFTRELLMDRRLDIYGEQFWRPYCHTHDLAGACMLAVTAASEQVAYEALNVGDTAENYQKKTLAELIVRQLPERATNVHFVKKDEDPRDYRVRCDKIKQAVGFEITRRVPDGIREIIDAIRSGVIDNPDDEYYVND